ncbi:DUF7935 family protein [Mucilaginibacter auburnensis]|uniref:Uncharacterized protein n=1 Tax=Mucilaginibacter auburnensis TaxID=1457233 RepID=A0A2H9VTH9_9SPHI|nr:hypothetical protein [Mucilaginibacter auburnensis]PJJ84133.1 hypothetical protein CLV57_1137 [Mucilaginibacter auburnensis]
MELYSFLLDILKYTVAGIGVVWVAVYLIKPYFDKQEQLQLLEFKKSISNQTLPLKLQAYERMVLFIERINPANMLIRLKAGDYTAAELHALVVSEVRNEYQHNITQQIYVSARTWGIVRQLKNDTIAIISNAAKALPENASGMELGKVVLAHLSQLEADPYDTGLNIIRNDLEAVI